MENVRNQFWLAYVNYGVPFKIKNDKKFICVTKNKIL